MRSLLAAALLLLVAACAPEVRGAGPANGGSRIEAFASPPLPWRLRVTTAFGPAPPEPRPSGPEPTEALVMPDGARLPLRVWRPEDHGWAGRPRFLLLALHGLGEHGGLFLTEPGPVFAAAGVLAYAYDQRGFGFAPHRGVWPGAETLRDDAIEAARLLRARHPGLPLYILGESMGGAVALLAGTAPNPPEASGYLLINPAVWGRPLIPGYARGALWVVSRTVPRLAVPASAGGLAASDNIEALRRFGADPLTLREIRVDLAHGVVDLMDDALAALPQCCRGPSGAPVPALFFVGAKDVVVPTRIQRQAFRRSGHKRVALYEEGWHQLLRDRVRGRVAADMLEFMANPTARVPAEADGARWLR